MKSYFLSDDQVKTETKEIFTKKRRPKYLKIRSLYPAHIFQADLFFYQNKTILSCIDVFSRKCYIQKCSNKSASAVLDAFKKVLLKFGKQPKVLMVDGGGEFLSVFQRYCRNEDIEIRIVKGDGGKDEKVKHAMGIVERVNRTFRQLISVYLQEVGKINFSQNDLDILIDNYNARKHSAFEPATSPDKVWNGKVGEMIVEYNESRMREGDEFEIGDKVRGVLIQRAKMSMNSKNKHTYTKSVYSITGRDGNRFLLSNGEHLPYSRLLRSNLEVEDKVREEKKEMKRDDEAKRKKRMKALTKQIGDNIPIRRSKRKK